MFVTSMISFFYASSLYDLESLYLAFTSNCLCSVCIHCYIPRTGVNTVKSKEVARIGLVNSALMPRIP